MKLIMTESQFEMITDVLTKEQDSQTSKAASGPQKCGITKGDKDGGSNREDKKWDKDVIRQERLDAKEKIKENSKEWSNFTNPNLDPNYDKLDKETKKSFTTSYNTFVNQNPEFNEDPSLLSPMQKFSILNKLSMWSRRSSQMWAVTKIRNSFKFEGTLSENQLYEVVKKIGGFDKFKEEYLQGLPSLTKK